MNTRTTFFLLILIGFFQLLTAQIDLGLVSYYPFNGDANDVQGYANNSEIFGATPTQDKNCISGRAYDFNGQSYIDTKTTFDFDNRSISFWFKADATDGNGFSSRGLLFMDSETLQYGAIRCHIIDGVLSMKTAGDPEYTSAAVVPNRWYHVVMIRSGSVTSYYLDGVHLGNGTNSNDGSSSNPYEFLVMGTDRHRDRRFYDGTIDEVRIYNRVLTFSDILALLHYEPVSGPDNDWLFTKGQSDLDPIYRRGQVAIGLTDPGNYQLAVNGITRTNELEVVPEGWPDYVFKPEYPLLSLDSVASYIQTQGHLPGIPDEAEALKGIRVAEMQQKLLAKIEELTLYILQQEKKIQEQDQRIKLLELKE